jgi:hypothetical protein
MGSVEVAVLSYHLAARTYAKKATLDTQLLFAPACIY